jgi:predicted Ser/Thr protein kinase
MPAQCPSCSHALADDHRFCPSCGAGLDVSATPTGTAPRAATSKAGRQGSDATRRSRTTPSFAAPSAHGRFEAGVVLAERYRIVGLIGKGGMGEVYSADDVKLEQPVALKFLPAGLDQDAERLERFFGEVRVARQVSHPAVCRVYDIGEADGQHFLSMEYVDGENLASLLRRIGRLAPDKALDIARQLCAGLAAAHAKGVLHRDLKPENVMLDGQGRVRITDFGLAGLADSFRSDDVRSGTPAYMSPEQLAGREVSARSDVYALGLVLYELFTGKRAFEGKGWTELARKHQHEAAPEPSLVVPDLDPAIERVILRCLEKDPKRRPPTALAVAAALPGGDPLAAALAAGETPSPEMVAAAGETDVLPPAAAWACLALVGLALVVVPWSAKRHQFPHRLADRPPPVLEDKARELVRKLGLQAAPVGTASGFAVDYELVRYARGSPQASAGLREGVPPAVTFYYRQSPRSLVSTHTSGRVYWTNPPWIVSGMAGAHYDLQGRLRSLLLVPPQVDPPAQSEPAEPDWSVLFEEAGLDQRQFQPVVPQWTPPFYCDTRAAWEGTWPGRPEIPLRVEAAAYRGQPVSFRLVSPWTRPERMEPFRFTALQRVTQTMMVVLSVVLVAAGAWLTRRNIRLGRVDRRGAVRVAAFVFAAGLVAWALDADHVAESVAELSLVARGAGSALLTAGLLWLFYLALEPYVRRLRPQTLIAWTRLLAGGWRDRLVGRDVLIGTAFGGFLGLLIPGSFILAALVSAEAADPWLTNLDAALGVRRLLATAVGLSIGATVLGMGSLLAFLLARLLLRKDWAAAAFLVAVLSVVQAGSGEGPLWLRFGLGLTIMAAYAFVLLRFGVLSAMVGAFVTNLLLNFPLSLDPGSWLSTPAAFVLPLVAALAVYAFRTATSGPPDAVHSGR